MHSQKRQSNQLRQENRVEMNALVDCTIFDDWTVQKLCWTLQRSADEPTSIYFSVQPNSIVRSIGSALAHSNLLKLLNPNYLATWSPKEMRLVGKIISESTLTFDNVNLRIEILCRTSLITTATPMVSGAVERIMWVEGKLDRVIGRDEHLSKSHTI